MSSFIHAPVKIANVRAPSDKTVYDDLPLAGYELIHRSLFGRFIQLPSEGECAVWIGLDHASGCASPSSLCNNTSPPRTHLASLTFTHIAPPPHIPTTHATPTHLPAAYVTIHMLHPPINSASQLTTSPLTAPSAHSYIGIHDVVTLSPQQHQHATAAARYYFLPHAANRGRCCHYPPFITAPSAPLHPHRERARCHHDQS